MSDPTPADEDTLLKQVKHDLYYYHAGRHHEREWIVDWLRTSGVEVDNPSVPELADAIENLVDLNDDLRFSSVRTNGENDGGAPAA